MKIQKGSFVVNEKFWIIVTILSMVFLLAVWLLLSQFFSGYVTGSAVSEVKICETFEKLPGLGRVGGCSE